MPDKPVDPAPIRNYRVTALVVAGALFMEQVDGTVLATALPSMARSFGADPLRMNVALTSYLLSLAVFIPASGRFADRLGSRTVFRGAIGLFTLGSILCGQAESVGFLIASRILQGIGGAMMVPVGRLVLLRTIPKADLVSAMAWLLIPATVGPVIGPPLGGFLVTHLSWRWIFYINVPIGLLGMIMASLFIDEIKADDPGPLDITGMALSGAALCGLMLGLESAARGVGSPAIWAGLLLGGLGAGLLYARHARHQNNPILDIRLLRVPTFRISVISGSLFRIAIGAVPFLLPLMLQLGFGFTAWRSGLTTFAGSAGALTMRVCAKPILRRFGFRRVMLANGVAAMAMVGTEAFLRPAWPEIAIYGVIMAAGFFGSLQFTAYNTIAYADLPAGRMSAATSLYSTLQQLSLSMGITIAAATLAVTTALRSQNAVTPGDFSIAFLVVAGLGALASPAARSLSDDAGQELSGHRSGTE